MDMEAAIQLIQQLVPSATKEEIAQAILMNEGKLNDAVNMLMTNNPVSHVPTGFQSDYNNDDKTILQIYGEHNSSCGYCPDSTKEERYSYGVTAKKMTCTDYQAFIDKGWRRSGTYMYHPSNSKTCCPNITIRLDVNKYKASKSQKTVYKKFNRFINTGNVESAMQITPAKEQKQPHNISSTKSPMQQELEAIVAKQLVSCLIPKLPNKQEETLEKEIEPILQVTLYNKRKNSNKKHKTEATDNNDKSNNTIQFATNVCFQLPNSTVLNFCSKEETETNEKAKKQAIMKARGLLANELVRCINEAHSSTNKESNSLFNSITASFAAPAFVNLQVVPKVQKKEEEKADMKQVSTSTTKKEEERPTTTSQPQQQQQKKEEEEAAPAHKFEIKMVPAQFEEESFQVYKQYQMVVHNDKESEVTRKGYTRFLCSSPLVNEKAKDENDPDCGYGSFHQKYYIDGKLVMVGVVDILPLCLSSVYLFYLPSHKFLTLGTYSAMKEIEWIQAIVNRAPKTKFHYYYMGYYVHECQKMKYKAKFKPSDLLCPVTCNWVPVAKCLPILDKTKFARLDTTNPTEFPVSKETKDKIIENVPIVIKNDVMSVSMLAERGVAIVKKLLYDFIDRTGSDLPKRIYFCFN